MRFTLALAALALTVACGQSAGVVAGGPTGGEPTRGETTDGPRVVPGACYATHFDAVARTAPAPAVDRRSNLLARPRRDDLEEPAPARVKPIVRIIGRPRVNADVDEAELDEALRRAVHKFRACYGKALRKNPRLSGTRTITLSVTGDGTVSSVRITGRDELLRTCVENALVLAKLPKPPSGSMTVELTVRFKPSVSTSAARRLPRPPPACIATVDSSPLVAAVSALQRCYDIALLDDPTVGGRIDFLVAPSRSVDLAGEVSEPLGGCIRNVLSRAAFDHDLDTATACTVLLDNPSTPPTDDEVRLALDLDDVTSVDGRILATADLEDRPLTYQTERALQSVLPDPLDQDRALRPRLAIRAHPGVDNGKIDAALSALASFALPSVSFARRVGVTDAWSIVNPLGTPSDPYCRPERTAVTVVVTARGFAVLAGGLVAYIDDRSDDDHDFEALSTALTTIRNTTLPHRSDLSIAGSPDTTYRDLLRTFELGIETGFFDTRHAQYDHVAAQIDRAAEHAIGGVE